MDRRIMALAFDAWLDDYINNPEKFEGIAETAKRHVGEKIEGRQPTYGEDCAAILKEYAARVVS